MVESATHSAVRIVSTTLCTLWALIRSEAEILNFSVLEL
jgi:hypothetical protein